MKKIMVYSKENKLIYYINKLIEKLKLSMEIVYFDLKEEKDYLLLNDNYNLKKQDVLCQYLFINMDRFKQANVKVNGKVVAYGFGSKNTITVSSVEEENMEFVYCIQRYLSIKDKSLIEPQEIPFKYYYNDKEEIYACMVMVTIALIEGIKIEQIKEYLIK